MSEFDQRGQQVENQINAYIKELNIRFADDPNVAKLMVRGVRQIQFGRYTQAIDSFDRVINLEPNSDALYYIALATLGRKRPRLQPLATIKEIEKYMQMAVQQERNCTHAYVLWAIVKEDYYVLNGLYETPPTPAQLLQHVESISIVHMVEMLTHIQAPENWVWKWLKKLRQS